MNGAFHQSRQSAIARAVHAILSLRLFALLPCEVLFTAMADNSSLLEMTGRFQENLFLVLVSMGIFQLLGGIRGRFHCSRLWEYEGICS